MRAAGIPAPSSSTERSGALLAALSRLRRCREPVDCAAAQLIIAGHAPAPRVDNGAAHGGNDEAKPCPALRRRAAVADVGSCRDRRDQDPARCRRRRLPAAPGHRAEGPDRAPRARRRRRQSQGGLAQARRPRARQRPAALGLGRHRRRRPAGLPHAVGPHPWQRRRQGRGGDDLDPHVPQHARATPQIDPRSDARRQDRHHGGEGLYSRHHHADGGDQGLRRGRLRALRQVHRRAHPSRCADRLDVGPRRHQRALCLPAVPPARAQGRRRAHDPDLQRRDGRPQHLHHALHAGQVPRRQSQGHRRLPEGAAGGDCLHQRRQARRRPDLPRHGRAGAEARRGAGNPRTIRTCATPHRRKAS